MIPPFSLECSIAMPMLEATEQLKNCISQANAWINDFKQYDNGTLSITIELEQKKWKLLLEKLSVMPITFVKESLQVFKFEVVQVDADEQIIINLFVNHFKEAEDI